MKRYIGAFITAITILGLSAPQVFAAPSVAGNLQNNHLSGSATVKNKKQTPTVKIESFSEPGTYSFSCGGNNFTQGEKGVNIQYTAQVSTSAGGNTRLVGGNGGAVLATSTKVLDPHSAIGVVNAKLFKKAYPSLYAHLVAQKPVDGIHYYNTSCGSFTLDDSQIEHTYLVDANLIVPWSATATKQNHPRVPYPQQYCPAGAATGPKPGWHNEVDSLGTNGKQIDQYDWQETVKEQGSQVKYNLTFGCAGYFQVTIYDLQQMSPTETKKIKVKQVYQPVYPTDLTAGFPPTPPPTNTSSSGGHLWISK